MPLGILAGAGIAAATGAGIGGIALGATLGGAAGSLLGLGGSGSAAGGASISAQQSAEQAATFQEQQTLFGEQQGFEKQLAALVADPSSVTKQPGYQFALDQGSQNIIRQLGAAGFAGSPGTAAAVQSYGQNTALGFYNQQVQTLAQLAGLYTPPSAASYGGNAVAAQGQSFNQMQNLMAQLGGAAGYYSGSYGAAGAGGFTGGPFDNVQPGGGFIPPDSGPPTVTNLTGGGIFAGTMGPP